MNSLGLKVVRDSSGKISDFSPDDSHLPQDEKDAFNKISQYISHKTEAGMTKADATDFFIRESSYSWANRLLALRCMESRGLIDEVILRKEIYGDRSLQHKRFAQNYPELCSGEDNGLVQLLKTEFAERSKEFPLLFNPEDSLVIIIPPIPDLNACIKLLSCGDEIFSSPDSLGWSYQYWNTEEKDRVFENVRTQKKKIQGKDIIPATQLYTEPYMVKFLVQNSLGATYMTMNPHSRLHEKWEYYVKDADRTSNTKKSVKEISFLDPACGSGHFLIEAFDLFFDMYTEEGEIGDPQEICGSILENNLFGIDIDERAVYISALSLIMKAKEKILSSPSSLSPSTPQFLPPRLNLVSTNIHFSKTKDHLNTFLDKHPEDKPLQNALKTVFDGIENISELGSLLQIEEPVDKELKDLKGIYDRERTGKTKKEYNGHFITVEEPSLFQELEKPKQIQLPLGVESFEEWKDKTVKRLIKHFEEESHSPDLSSKFFGIDALKGLSFFDIISRKFDVVATNPPYMGSKNMADNLKKYVSTHYRQGKRDLYASFILRNIQMCKQNGRIAMVTQQSWMFLRSFAELRATPEENNDNKTDTDNKNNKNKSDSTEFKGILKETSIETLAHLGEHAFNDSSAAGAFVALFTLSRFPPLPEHRIIAFRLVGANTPNDKQLLLNKNQINMILVYNQIQCFFQKIPESPIFYWLSKVFLNIFTSPKRFTELGIVKQGIHTLKNIKYVRYFWEISDLKRWLPYEKGGGFQKWFGFQNFCVSDRMNNNALDIDGATYTDVARGSMGCRLMPKGNLFDVASPGITPFRKENVYPIIGILNSRVASYIFRAICPSFNHIGEGYVNIFPLYPNKSLTSIISILSKLAIN